MGCLTVSVWMQNFIIIEVKTMENKTMTKQEKERLAQEKREARRIEYANSHFVVTWYEQDKNGNLREIHDVISGTYDTDTMTVLFKIDQYSLYYAVDNHMGGLFLYRMCKTRESSSKYNRYSRYSKTLEKENKDYLVQIVGDITTIDKLIAKAKIAKGFKPMTNSRELECAPMAHQRANTVYNNHMKALAKKQEKEAEAAAV